MYGDVVIGVDVGGTFTDILYLDTPARQYRTAKVPTSADDQSRGFMAGIEAVAPPDKAVSSIIHGTTVATNALLERKGARAGLLTTEGFRDVLEMRRRDRPTTWGLRGSFSPVVTRDLRLEIPERMRADGSVHRPLDPEALLAALQELKEKEIESLAISFMNAYANPAHEEQALALVRAHWPDLFVTIATDLLAEVREFERTSTAVLNAYVQPVIHRYFERLRRQLSEMRGSSAFLVVQSNGGMTTVEEAGLRPVRTALSGPAAGVIAGAHIAKTAGFPNAITCDMGGTSFDVSLIIEGESARIAETSVDFGLVIRSPMIEIHTIGAGGGSIAWIDGGGILNIGPDSAGADPGPACYGRGNNRPTVTDANLVLGRINPQKPLGQSGQADAQPVLDVEAAKQAITRTIAEPLNLDVNAAADAIIQVANARMAAAIRLLTVERGHDPRNFIAVTFGGGGALHAGALLREVGLMKALVPPNPGITSALGCAIADMRYDFVQTVNTLLADADLPSLRKRIVSLWQQGQARLAQSGAGFVKTVNILEFDMSYVGQSHTIAVPFLESDFESETFSIKKLKAAFETAYRKHFSRLLPDQAVRVLSLRAAVIGERQLIDLTLFAPHISDQADPTIQARRRVFADNTWHDTPVYDRGRLAVGSSVAGPALIEQPDTTIFVDPGLVGETDRFGNLIIS